jgi:hypothetical protein
VYWMVSNGERQGQAPLLGSVDSSSIDKHGMSGNSQGMSGTINTLFVPFIVGFLSFVFLLFMCLLLSLFLSLSRDDDPPAGHHSSDLQLFLDWPLHRQDINSHSLGSKVHGILLRFPLWFPARNIPFVWPFTIHLPLARLSKLIRRYIASIRALSFPFSF